MIYIMICHIENKIEYVEGSLFCIFVICVYDDNHVVHVSDISLFRIYAPTKNGDELLFTCPWTERGKQDV